MFHFSSIRGFQGLGYITRRRRRRIAAFPQNRGRMGSGASPVISGRSFRENAQIYRLSIQHPTHHGPQMGRSAGTNTVIWDSPHDGDVLLA